MNARRLALAAATVAALGSTPAHAATYGGGPATGNYSCASGTAGVALASPAFDFNGAVGPFWLTGLTDCEHGSVVVDYGSGTFDVAGPGVTCTGLGGGWQRIGTRFQLIVGGPCAFAGGGGHNVQFLFDGVVAAGHLAGAVAVVPTT